jgi:hypothetical protein
MDGSITSADSYDLYVLRSHLCKGVGDLLWPYNQSVHRRLMPSQDA